MKKLFFLLLLFPAMGMVNPGSFNLAAITKALNEGNADALGQYFDNTVEVAVMDNEEVYSKAEAIRIVKDFFSKNKPSSFSQVHHGASKGQDSQYCIGNLVASSGTFRVYVYMKVSGGKYLIQELRFDKE